MRSSTTNEGACALVIDDNRQICSVMKTCLQSAGFEVLTHTRGQDAIECYAERAASIAVSLVDLDLADMSGHAVTDALRAIRADALVIHMSGYSLEDAIEGAHAQGGEFWFLAKPFLPKQLLDYVSRARSAHERAMAANLTGSS